MSILDDSHSPEQYSALSLPGNDENHNVLQTRTFDHSLLEENSFKFLREEEISMLRMPKEALPAALLSFFT